MHTTQSFRSIRRPLGQTGRGLPPRPIQRRAPAAALAPWGSMAFKKKEGTPGARTKGDVGRKLLGARGRDQQRRPFAPASLEWANVRRVKDRGAWPPKRESSVFWPPKARWSPLGSIEGTRDRSKRLGARRDRGDHRKHHPVQCTNTSSKTPLQIIETQRRRLNGRSNFGSPSRQIWRERRPPPPKILVCVCVFGPPPIPFPTPLSPLAKRC